MDQQEWLPLAELRLSSGTRYMNGNPWGLVM